jgi:methylglutaconyl-CoA hydratase
MARRSESCAGLFVYSLFRILTFVFQMINVQVENRVGVITLNSPENRNALGPAMVSELTQAIEQMNSNSNVRAVVLRAVGPAFCSGADLAYLNNIREFSFEENLNDSQRLRKLFDLIHAGPKIYITEVNGPAMAGGCGLATIADFCFASPESVFGYTEARIGFVPALVMVYLQQRLSGKDLRELMLTSKILSAQEAAVLGLINKVVPTAELVNYTNEFAQNLITSVSGSSVARIKSMLRKIPSLPFDDALDFAARNNAEARQTEDCLKGINAFLNKEKIQW